MVLARPSANTIEYKNLRASDSAGLFNISAIPCLCLKIIPKRYPIFSYRDILENSSEGTNSIFLAKKKKKNQISPSIKQLLICSIYAVF